MKEPKKPRVQRREPVKPVAEPALDKLGLELTELLTKIVPKSLNSQVHAEIAVSYTHLTLPTICSV